MRFRVLRPWGPGVLIAAVVSCAIDARASSAGQSLRYPASIAGEDDAPWASASDSGETTWVGDDDSLASTIGRGRRKPSPVMLVQATEPAPATLADEGSPLDASPQPAGTPAGEGGGGGYGALGSTLLLGMQSVMNAEGDYAGALDAALLRAQHDAATLLRDVPGMSLNAHAPIVHETSLRGRRLGQIPAKGSYWFPARQDLDTMMSKIDSQLVDRIVSFHGPYSALYGPGLGFYEIQLLRAPRYEPGTAFQVHSNTALQYETNGEQWLGRQGFWGGDGMWGFRGGYGHRGGSDYETGAGDSLPSSYKSRQVDLALGGMITPDSTIDFQYLRLDQTDLEFPGQFFDINALVTDSYSLTYVLKNRMYYDSLTVDGWFNETNFYGDNLRPGKRALLPLDNQQRVPGALINTRLNSRTDVSAHSAGFRTGLGWEDGEGQKLVAGVDLRYLGQRIDEISDFTAIRTPLDGQGAPAGPPQTILDQTISNPQPNSRSANPGLFAEWERPVTDQLSMRTGGRFDWVSMDARSLVDGVPDNLEDVLGGDFDQRFNLGSGFLQLDYQITDVYSVNAGSGYGMRPPTMTEMYAVGPFVAVLPQYIFTSVFGDPNLRPEKMVQVDVGAAADYGLARSGVSVYHAWVEDYITLDFLDTGASSAYAFVNTPRATLAGFEAYGECDITTMLTGFGTMSFVEGRDHSRNETISRQRQLLDPGAQNNERSARLNGTPGALADKDSEALAVLAPLTNRIGLRLHPEGDNALWNIEFAANVIDNQDRVASSLRELITPGYTTYDILANARMTDSFTLTGGVRNFTDKYYQTYFDTRQAGAAPITTVFQPGITFFFGCEYTR